MKTSSKIYFASGVLATIGALSLAYAVFKDTDKSPKQLLNDGKRFIKRSLRNGDRMIDETLDTIDDEAKAIIQDAKELV
jgi:hypothetical protein